MKKRLMSASAIVAAGLVLSACGNLTPGVAAQVGDETISTQRVDAVATSYCTALSDQLEAQGTVVPMSFVKRSAVYSLTLRSMADQIAEEFGVTPGSTYRHALAQQEVQARSVPEEARADFLEVSTANAYASDVLDQVGRIKLAAAGVANPTLEQIGEAGMDVFRVWPDINGLEFDPRYGLEHRDGEVEPVDTNTSVAVSEQALRGLDEEPTPAYVASLPAAQRCG